MYLLGECDDGVASDAVVPSVYPDWTYEYWYSAVPLNGYVDY